MTCWTNSFLPVSELSHFSPTVSEKLEWPLPCYSAVLFCLNSSNFFPAFCLVILAAKRGYFICFGFCLRTIAWSRGFIVLLSFYFYPPPPFSCRITISQLCPFDKYCYFSQDSELISVGLRDLLENIITEDSGSGGQPSTNTIPSFSLFAID